MAVVRHKEAIHSGHFMISDFEAEAEAEEDISVPQAEEGSNIPQLVPADEVGDISPVPPSLPEPKIPESAFIGSRANQALSIIDISLNKLFQSMSIAYRHKLTSPKWNKFRGLKLRWKDKIRLNNVIWRCWHMQFIKGRNQLLCAFANPLEIDNHDHTEGSTVLEGKYWKRQLQTVTSEYKQWRLFYKHRGAEHEEINGEEWEQLFQHPFQLLEGSKDDASLIPDEENFMEALFNSIAQDPNSRSFMGQTLAVPFPNPREMHRNTTNADFIQPGLVQLQPNLEDFFSDMDGINQLPDWLTNRLPSIQEGPLDGHAPPAGNIHSKPSSNPSGGVQPMYTTINISDVEANDLTRNSVMASLQPAATTDQQYNEQVQSQGEQPYPTTSFAGTVETPSASKYNIDATSSAGASRYPGPISHPKRNSPKHRILCQREYAPDYNYSPSSPSGLSRRMSNSTSQYQSSGLVQASSPYHLPVSTASSDPPGAMPSIGKARSFSNPPMSRPSWKHSPAVEANSELVQLLRSNSKTPRTLPAIESPPVTEPLALRVPSEPDPSPRAALMIPPPSPQSHPQPSFTIGAGPSSRSTKSPPESSVGADHRHGVTNAEQRRRGSIQNGFDLLKSLIPALNQSNRVKISKAALLHKGGDYIQQMKSERSGLKQEIESLRSQVDELNQDIHNFQGSLPTASIDVTKSGTESLQSMEELFHEHVRHCTQLNWKYWVFSLLMKPLLQSFHQSVKIDSINDMCRTSMSWLDQECSLTHLRPTVLNALKQLSTETDILTNPGQIPEEAVRAVQRPFSSLSFQAEAVLLPIRGNNDFEVESEDSHPETKLKGVVDL